MDSMGDSVKKALANQVLYAVELCSDSDIEEKDIFYSIWKYKKL